MPSHAAGTIESKSFSFSPVEELENGNKLLRMSAMDLFHGDIEGEALAEFVALLRTDQSSKFVGVYRVSGELQGRKGSFLLEVNGSGTAKGLSTGTWNVMQGSSTASLAGLKGSGCFSFQSGGSSALSLDYEFVG
jgi:hypothetical protein